MLKEAIEKIEELAKPEIFTEACGRSYVVGKDGETREIIPEAVYQDCLALNSLDALVQMVRTEGVRGDRSADKLYLSVKDHMTVACFGHPQKDLREARIFYYEAQAKLNGLGDITISKVNLLNLYWEPGITDIQRSRYFFHTELMDKDLLEEQYPEQLKGKLTGQSFLSTRFLYDDTVSTDGKVTVVECYYHKYVQGRKTVQYVKYVNDQVIFATENDPALAQRGLYDHAMYPYVFDALFPIEGSPCGYGFVDICRNPQTCIDLLNTSFVKNAMAGATPRYFKRQDGGINETEFLDLTKSIVNVNGNLGEDSLRQIPFQPLDGVYVSYACYAFGKDSFGIIDPDGGGAEMIVHDKSEIGGPLNQFSTIGYKFETNGATMLYPERMLRVMAVSSYSATDTAN